MWHLIPTRDDEHGYLAQRGRENAETPIFFSRLVLGPPASLTLRENELFRDSKFFVMLYVFDA
jgi:hypothetical protein